MVQARVNIRNNTINARTIVPGSKLPPSTPIQVGVDTPDITQNLLVNEASAAVIGYPLKLEQIENVNTVSGIPDNSVLVYSISDGMWGPHPYGAGGTIDPAQLALKADKTYVDSTFLTANQPITFLGDATGLGTNTVTLTLSDIGVTAGSYSKITVDAKGRVTSGDSLSSADIMSAIGNGSITNNMLENTSVSSLSGTNTGDETTATIKTKLGITSISGTNTGDQTITLTGDVTGSGTGAFNTQLSSTGVAGGTYNKVVVDEKGRVISATLETTLDGIGITDAVKNTGSTKLTHGGVGSFTATMLSTLENQIVDSISIFEYRAAKYVIQVTNESSYQMTEIDVIHDGSTTYMTEFGPMCTTGVLAMFDTNVVGNQLQLLATPINETPTIIKAVKTLIAI